MTKFNVEVVYKTGNVSGGKFPELLSDDVEAKSLTLQMEATNKAEAELLVLQEFHRLFTAHNTSDNTYQVERTTITEV